MHPNYRRPVLMPKHDVPKLDRLTKAALMDLAWVLADALAEQSGAKVRVELRLALMTVKEARKDKRRSYVGVKGDKRELLRLNVIDAKVQAPALYDARIGPFRTMRAARLCAASRDEVLPVREYERLAVRTMESEWGDMYKGIPPTLGSHPPGDPPPVEYGDDPEPHEHEWELVDAFEPEAGMRCKNCPATRESST